MPSGHVGMNGEMNNMLTELSSDVEVWPATTMKKYKERAEKGMKEHREDCKKVIAM